jgi:DNA-directed RNA polymerase specialized sigma subunit
LTPSEDALNKAWKAWQGNKNAETMQALTKETQPIVAKALTSYAPNSSPAVKSYAKILVRKALHSYDPAKEAKLRTHLMIQLQPLQREAGTYETLHIPERVRLDRSVIDRRSNEFLERNGYEPSDSELADFSGLSVKRLQHIRQYAKMQVPESRTRPQSENDISTPPTEIEGLNVWKEAVYDGLGSMDQRIYDLKTGKNNSQNPLSVNEIAGKLKMTPSAISQRLSKIDRLMASAPVMEEE